MIGSIVITAAAAVGFVVWGIPYFFSISLPIPANIGFGSEVVPAQVTQIIDEGTVNLGGISSAVPGSAG